MDGNLKFSVITVCFNAELEIRKTIESILNQSYLPYEYIIIDGLSNDKTIEIANEYIDEFNKKNVIYNIYSEKDTGIYNAMNKGINKANGDFISFLNAGDWYELDALENVNNLYHKNAFDITYGYINYIKQDGTSLIKKSKYDKFWTTSRHWNHPSMFMRTVVYNKECFDEQFKIYSDFELFLRIKRKKYKISINKNVVANFVADGISTKTNKEIVKKRAEEKYLAYRKNHYSRLYWFEAYGWEKFKSIYFNIHKKKE